MRKAETVHLLIRERGKKGLPLERVYRLLYNPELFLSAYGKISRNAGAMTPGTTGETVDGMSQDKIAAIIELLRYERYVWSPARRVYIPKKNGKQRPLGLPDWSDKLLQEVLRMILTDYYEPQFSERSHGFRPDRGCHTALREIHETWTGTTWFIEGDIKGCFDNIDHTVLLNILRESIHDERFIHLISTMLEAGYLEGWNYKATLSGTPQGGVISPILSNIYLHKLDEFVEKQLIPTWTKGQKRRKNLAYVRLADRASYCRSTGRTEKARTLRKQMQQLPSNDTQDPGYRRLRYVRYADDFVLGFIGPKSEAEQIKERIGEFLRDTLKLELSEAKTLVTHARAEKARFLGYEIHTIQGDSYQTNGQRRINGRIGLRVPEEVVKQKCQEYMSGGKPKHRAERIKDRDFSILEQFQAEYRGVANYYRLAYNLVRMGELRWVMERSLVKTLAAKHNTSGKNIYGRYRANITVDGRVRKVLQVKVDRPGKEPLVATWGGIPLTWNPKATLTDQPRRAWNGRTELEQRLLADVCEYCGSTEEIEVHHIRALKDLNRHKGREKPEWMQLMAARKRKTMVLCRECHLDVTHGRPMRNKPSGTGFMHDPKGWNQSWART